MGADEVKTVGGACDCKMSIISQELGADISDIVQGDRDFCDPRSWKAVLADLYCWRGKWVRSLGSWTPLAGMWSARRRLSSWLEDWRGLR
jgi:hypothetical protein